MKYNTKRYNITKVDPEEFNGLGAKQYEINLKAGYIFESYGTHIEYAADIEDLRSLIADIKKEG